MKIIPAIIGFLLLSVLALSGAKELAGRVRSDQTVAAGSGHP